MVAGVVFDKATDSWRSHFGGLGLNSAVLQSWAQKIISTERDVEFWNPERCLSTSFLQSGRYYDEQQPVFSDRVSAFLNERQMRMEDNFIQPEHTTIGILFGDIPFLDHIQKRVVDFELPVGSYSISLVSRYGRAHDTGPRGFERRVRHEQELGYLLAFRSDAAGPAESILMNKEIIRPTDPWWSSLTAYRQSKGFLTLVSSVLDLIGPSHTITRSFFALPNQKNAEFFPAIKRETLLLGLCESAPGLYSINEVRKAHDGRPLGSFAAGQTRGYVIAYDPSIRRTVQMIAAAWKSHLSDLRAARTGN